MYLVYMQLSEEFSGDELDDENEEFPAIDVRSGSRSGQARGNANQG